MKIKAWMRSFQARSVIASLIACLFIWLLWSGWELWNASHEGSTYYDTELKLGAEQVMRSIPKTVIELPDVIASQTTPEMIGTPLDKDEFNFQVWTKDKRLVLLGSTTPKKPLNPSFVPGAHSSTIDGVAWRVYTLDNSKGDLQVQVGFSLNQRKSAASFIVVDGLRGLVWLLIPITFGLIIVSVWTARPLRRLRDVVAQREAGDHVPLPHDHLPSEVIPLVTSFNELLKRIGIAREAQQRFVSDAAHELRTPLAALRIQAQVAMRMKDDERRQEALARLIAGIDRITRVAEQLLDLARVDNLRLQKQVSTSAVDVSALIEDLVAESAQSSARRHVPIQVNLPERVMYVQADDGLLSIALRNLLDNAIRYSPDNRVVQVVLEEHAQQAIIRITNDGPGLSAEQKEQALQPFVRLSQTGEPGSGLGLSIVQRVCELQGISFELLDRTLGTGLEARLVIALHKHT